eukprot:scaffold6661_cov122-Skeletonema_marinoi.AAC.6
MVPWSAKKAESTTGGKTEKLYADVVQLQTELLSWNSYHELKEEQSQSQSQSNNKKNNFAMDGLQNRLGESATY